MNLGQDWTLAVCCLSWTLVYPSTICVSTGCHSFRWNLCSENLYFQLSCFLGEETTNLHHPCMVKCIGTFDHTWMEWYGYDFAWPWLPEDSIFRRCLDHSVSARPWLTFFCQADTTVFVEPPPAARNNFQRGDVYVWPLLFPHGGNSEGTVSPFLTLKKSLRNPPKRKRSGRVCLFSI